jgi:hypothetical protein
MKIQVAEWGTPKKYLRIVITLSGFHCILKRIGQLAKLFLTFSKTKLLLGLSCHRIGQPVFVSGQLSSFNIFTRSISGPGEKKPTFGHEKKPNSGGKKPTFGLEKRSYSAPPKVSKKPVITSLLAPIKKLGDQIEVKI